MIDLEETDRGIRAVDAAKNEVEIGLEGWVPGGEELEIDRNVDVVISGSVNSVKVPATAVMIDSTVLNQRTILLNDESLTLSRGKHVCQIAVGLTTYLRFDGAVSVWVGHDSPGSHNVLLNFHERNQISIGIRSESHIANKSIGVDPTPAGLANAISKLGLFHNTETPDRSYPSNRSHPPILYLDKASHPNDDNSDGVIRPTIKVPPSFEFLFPTAPLAYYTSAVVVTEERITPKIVTKDIHYELTNEQTFSEQILDLLRRIFYLDCLIREAGPNGVGIEEYQLIDNDILDPDEVYGMTISERITEYLSYPFQTISGDLPRWPLSVYVRPSSDNIPILSHLLDRLASVHEPESRPLDNLQMVEQSLEKYSRSGSADSNKDGLNGSQRPVEVLGADGVCRGWVANGTAVNAFNCSFGSFANSQEYLRKPSRKTSITVVMNDSSMQSESNLVLNTYQNRANNFPIDVQFVEDTTRDELAELFEIHSDFVHFVGHSDPDGLVCVDGNLSFNNVSKCNARTFLLNACGSLQFGKRLIEKGGAAGVVTIGDVIDNQAQKFGSNFAFLLMNGFTVEQSISYARSQILLNHRYTALGDGTQVLVQGDTIEPMILDIQSCTDGNYRVSTETVPIRLNGGVYRSYTSEKPHILGKNITEEISENALCRLLEITTYPVLFDGKIYAPGELLESYFD